ncbi:MAG TPA: copper resistance protein CopC [Devosia sp.]|nr:copper resistance protein CopC [Devosia sp.]
MLLLGIGLVVLFFCSQVQAHATLTGTSPADGAVLAVPPDAVTLSFNEPVSLIVATLVIPGGATVALDRFTASATTVSVGLPADLGHGSHALSWRAVSDDGHPISGTMFFVVGSPSAAPVAELQSPASTVVGLLWSARLILFIGLFFGVGGAAFRILAELPPQAMVISQWAIVSGLIAIPMVLGLQGLDLLGGNPSQLLEGRPWWLGLTSSYGVTLGLACVALLLGLIALQTQSRRLAKVTAGIAILVTGLAISASGHASAADPQWLTRPALFMHVTTIAWWVGALIPLILLLRQDQHVASPALIRFSRAIPFAIMPLVGSGAILAVIQLGPPGQTWWLPYGQILAAKLSLLVVLFAIASWNRWVLTVPAAAGDELALKRMRRGIVAEIVIILAVLGLVSAWRFTPPPRALAAEIGTPIVWDLTKGSVRAIVTLSSGRVGEMDAQIAIETALGEPLSPKSVKLSLEPENGLISPIVRAASPTPKGEWRIEELNVPFADTWSVTVQVRVTDFELSKLTGVVEIGP